MAKKKQTSVELVKWTGDDAVRFFVSNKEMRLFNDLGITGEVATEEKTEGTQGYKQIKNTKSTKITMTALLLEAFGVDVRKVAMAMVEDARLGKSGILNLGGKKLVKYSMMLTKAEVSEVDITVKGKWASCKVELTFEQSSIGSGNEEEQNGGGGGGGYAGYATWMSTTNSWLILKKTPPNKSLYTGTTTINGKKYHTFKARTRTETPQENISRNQYVDNFMPGNNK